MKLSLFGMMCASLTLSQMLSAVRAGEAVFAADGKSVLCITPQTATVLQISLTVEPVEEPEVFDLSNALGEQSKLRAICRGADGAYVLAASGGLYTWKPGSDPEKTGTVTEGHVMTDLAVHAGGLVMAPGYRDTGDSQHDALLVREPGEKELMTQESLPQSMTATVFDADGRFFFGVGACLCAGGVRKYEDGSTSTVSWPVTVLDAPGLDNGTSNSSLSITGIAPAGTWLYLTMASDVDCLLLRLPRPDIKTKDGNLTAQPEDTRKLRWKRFSSALTKVEALESEDQPYFSTMRGVCASPDGKRVFLTGTPILHPEREEYWTINVKTGARDTHGERVLEP